MFSLFPVSVLLRHYSSRWPALILAASRARICHGPSSAGKPPRTNRVPFPINRPYVEIYDSVLMEISSLSPFVKPSGLWNVIPSISESRFLVPHVVPVRLETNLRPDAGDFGLEGFQTWMRGFLRTSTWSFEESARRREIIGETGEKG